ncbi:MAG: hypothetical protein ACOZCP_03090 [Pseudomonadota bacterium]
MDLPKRDAAYHPEHRSWNRLQRKDRKGAKAAKNDPQPHLLGVGRPSGFFFASFALLRVLCVKCGFQVDLSRGGFRVLANN